MLKTNGVVRTVDVQELKVEKRKDTAGNEYDDKSILFTVASNRNYKVAKKDAQGNIVMENGAPVMEYPSDFMFCKARGALAQVIADFCMIPVTDDQGNIVKKENGKTKYHSRKLNLSGHIEKYNKVEELAISKEIEINGAKYKVDFPVQMTVEKTIYMVESIDDFLDPNPAPVVKAGTTTTQSVSVTPVSVTPITAQGASAPAINVNTGNAQLNNNAQVVVGSSTEFADLALAQLAPTSDECPF